MKLSKISPYGNVVVNKTINQRSSVLDFSCTGARLMAFRTFGGVYYISVMGYRYPWISMISIGMIHFHRTITVVA